jgi:3-deoxy-7-phosphoheptulonate synthase
MQDRQLYNVNIQPGGIKPLPTPRQILHVLPVSPKARTTVLEGREGIQEIISGKSSRLLILVGPCSIHHPPSARKYAMLLKQLANKVGDKILLGMRVYFDKPRTTVGWKGLISDATLNDQGDVAEGIKQARDLLLEVAELGLPSATEFVNPNIPQYLADLVCWNALGARTVESQSHREFCSGLSMPVGCKNGTGGNLHSIRIAAQAVETIRHPHKFLSLTEDGLSAVVPTTGNPWGHVVLRGGVAGTNYDAESVAGALKVMKEEGVHQHLVVDCSHGNCYKQHEMQSVAFRDVLAQRVSGNTNIVGIMVESHLKAGKYDHNPVKDDPAQIPYGVSITDPCVGWEETEELILEAYGALSRSPIMV